ncbi:hypothetical protein SK128_009826, partial [Halocaridina rubra]
MKPSKVASTENKDHLSKEASTVSPNIVILPEGSGDVLYAYDNIEYVQNFEIQEEEEENVGDSEDDPHMAESGKTKAAES